MGVATRLIVGACIVTSLACGSLGLLPTQDVPSPLAATIVTLDELAPFVDGVSNCEPEVRTTHLAPLGHHRLDVVASCGPLRVYSHVMQSPRADFAGRFVEAWVRGQGAGFSERRDLPWVPRTHVRLVGREAEGTPGVDLLIASPRAIAMWSIRGVTLTDEALREVLSDEVAAFERLVE